MAAIAPVKQKLASSAVSNADAAASSQRWTSRLRKRVISLVAISVISYPVLVGLGLLTSLVTVIPAGPRGETSRLFYSASMYVTTFGLTIAVAMGFIYAGAKRWETSLQRSKRKAMIFGVYGTVATLLVFPLFAILLAIVDALVHRQF